MQFGCDLAGRPKAGLAFRLLPVLFCAMIALVVSLGSGMSSAQEPVPAQQPAVQDSAPRVDEEPGGGRVASRSQVIRVGLRYGPSAASTLVIGSTGRLSITDLATGEVYELKPVGKAYRLSATALSSEKVTFYRIRLGAFTEKLAADQVLASAASRGFSAYAAAVLLQNGLYEAHLGMFYSRDEAEAAAASLAQASIKGDVAEFSASASYVISVTDEGGEEVARLSGPLRVQAAKPYLWVGDVFLFLESPARPYRGSFEVSLDEMGRLKLVNKVALEDYLYGVLPAEMSASAPLEALKAQAVVARTVALSSIGRHAKDGFDVCATTHCQVYEGAYREKDSTAVHAAVDGTRGQVVTYAGKLAGEVKYFSTCGGFTESAEDIWGTQVPYLVGVACGGEAAITGSGGNGDVNGGASADTGGGTGAGVTQNGQDGSGSSAGLKSGQGGEADLSSEEAMRRFLDSAGNDFCKDSSRHRWAVTLSLAEVNRLVSVNLPGYLGDPALKTGEVLDLMPVSRTKHGALVAIEIRTTTGAYQLKGELRIRNLLGGPVAVPSAAFVVDRNVTAEGRLSGFTLRGAGYGHRVGMCQTGAYGMARAGYGYEDILRHYYIGVQVQTVY